MFAGVYSLPQEGDLSDVLRRTCFLLTRPCGLCWRIKRRDPGGYRAPALAHNGLLAIFFP